MQNKGTKLDHKGREIVIFMLPISIKYKKKTLNKDFYAISNAKKITMIRKQQVPLKSSLVGQW